MIYKAVSRATCERFCNQKHPLKSIIISIKSSWDPDPPKVFCSDTNKVQAILSLAFDDVEADDSLMFLQGSKEHCMTHKDAMQVRDFVKEWFEKVDMIIVHCDAGVSRSAGIVSALMQIYDSKGWVMWKTQSKSPNMTCFLRTLEAFNYKI